VKIMEENKRYIVFAYDDYERGGGCNDIHCVTISFEEAEKAACSDEARSDNDTVEIYDIQKNEVVCSFYRTVKGEWVREK